MKILTILRNFALVLAMLAMGSLYAVESDKAVEEGGAELSPITGGQHRFELAKQYYGQCENADGEKFELIRPYLQAFTDVEVMADTMADPAKFMALMAAVNDPHTLHVMSKCASEPVMWDTWMKNATDINKMSRAMTRFMNPGMYFTWMSASMNPATYQPMMKMSDPAYFNKWMIALGNPAFYQPVTSLANPDWYAPRFAWMSNPQSMQPFFNMMNTAWQPQAVTATAAATE